MAIRKGPNADSSDMSVTGWALMFLSDPRGMRNSMCRNSTSMKAWTSSSAAMKKDTSDLHEKGVFRYRPLDSDRGANPQITLANTASSMLTLILGGRHTHKGIATGAEWFRSRDYPRPWQEGYYYLSSYYSSQAMAQIGGDTWNQSLPPNRPKSSCRANQRRQLAHRWRRRTQLRHSLQHLTGHPRPDTSLSTTANLSAMISRECLTRSVLRPSHQRLFFRSRRSGQAPNPLRSTLPELWQFGLLHRRAKPV